MVILLSRLYCFCIKTNIKLTNRFLVVFIIIIKQLVILYTLGKIITMDLTEDNRLNLEAVSGLLDKLALRQLHLMEEKMQNVINAESKIHEGSIHLAKSRYIMGQTSVSTTRLPTEGSPEFSASVLVQCTDDKQFELVENNAEDTINPLKWFGILVPQNMHRAREIFQNTVKYVVECAGIQSQIYENMSNFIMLKKYKQSLKAN